MHTIVRIMVLISLGFLLIGCNEAEEITADEFQAMLCQDLETMHYSEFLGVRDGKAYMKVASMSTIDRKEWKEQYYYTEAQGLPEEWLREQQELIKK